MQTFLPHESFKKSLKVLDWRRLGKQRVEAHQVLNVLLGRTETKGWVNHPITRMWDGYEPALQLYFNMFANNVPILEDVWTVLLAVCLFRMVELGDKR